MFYELATGRWFSPGPPVCSTNKTDRHDVTEILLKVTLNTIKPTNQILQTWCINCRKPAANKAANVTVSVTWDLMVENAVLLGDEYLRL
jgi:hypothetical protein